MDLCKQYNLLIFRVTNNSIINYYVIFSPYLNANVFQNQKQAKHIAGFSFWFAYLSNQYVYLQAEQHM